MIERAAAFKVGDKTFGTLAEAQKAELLIILGIEEHDSTNAEAVTAKLLQAKDKVVDILTTTESSRLKARRINGGTKKRTPKGASSTAPAAA